MAYARFQTILSRSRAKGNDFICAARQDVTFWRSIHGAKRQAHWLTVADVGEGLRLLAWVVTDQSFTLLGGRMAPT